MDKIEQLYEDVLGFYEDHDLELMNDKERQAFKIVIGILADFSTHIKEKLKLNKEDLEWYFKKDEEKVYYSSEVDRVYNIEKRFIEECLGEEKVKEIYDFAQTCGISHEWKGDSLKIIRILLKNLLKKLMREYLDSDEEQLK